jgi:PadR family transcriptional regulator PadR
MVKTLTENASEQLVQHIVRNLLDIHILRLVQAEPMWGYNIIKKVKTLYGIKIRHGALYPLLNKLERNDYVRSKREIQKGRIRKTYMITEKGKQLIQTYYNILKQQIKEKDIQNQGE